MKKIFLLFIFIFSAYFSFSNNTVLKEYFGIHFHDITTFNEDWSDFPLNSIRIWDAGVIWPDLEPRKGEWNFTKLDEIVCFAEKHNLEIIMTLGQTPGWATKKKNLFYPYGRKDICTSVPDNIEDWNNYVRVLGERYKGKIKYWEVWNEPDHPYFFSGTPKQLVDLARECNVILKGIDNSNKIISPSITSNPFALGFLDSFLFFGGKKYVDIIGYHYYTMKSFPPEVIRFQIKTLKSIMKKHKIENKELWTTEGGIFLKNADYHTFISFLARMYLIQKAYGSERFFWYAFDNGAPPASGGLMVDDKTAINDGGIAYKNLFNWLNGYEIVSTKNSFNTWIITLKKENQSKYIIWNTNGQKKYKISENLGNLRNIYRLDGNIDSIENNNQIIIDEKPIMLD
jgi:hypothetical protein